MAGRRGSRPRNRPAHSAASGPLRAAPVGRARLRDPSPIALGRSAGPGKRRSSRRPSSRRARAGGFRPRSRHSRHRDPAAACRGGQRGRRSRGRIDRARRRDRLAAAGSMKRGRETLSSSDGGLKRSANRSARPRRIVTGSAPASCRTRNSIETEAGASPAPASAKRRDGSSPAAGAAIQRRSRRPEPIALTRMWM